MLICGIGLLATGFFGAAMVFDSARLATYIAPLAIAAVVGIGEFSTLIVVPFLKDKSVIREA